MISLKIISRLSRDQWSFSITTVIVLIVTYFIIVGQHNLFSESYIDKFFCKL